LEYSYDARTHER